MDTGTDTKSCVVCGNEFRVTRERGHEQKYCSKQCRQISINNRRNEKDKQLRKAYMQIKQHENIQAKAPELNAQSSNIPERAMGGAVAGGWVTPDMYLQALTTNYECRNTINKLELQVENLQNKLNEANSTILEMESELDEHENPEEDNNMISGVIKQWKADPINTSAFAVDVVMGIVDKFKNNRHANTVKSDKTSTKAQQGNSAQVHRNRAQADAPGSPKTGFVGG